MLKALQEIGYHMSIPVTPEQFADPDLRESWRSEKNMFVLRMWSDEHRRIADRLKISLVLVQELLQTGREQLKRKLTSREPKPGLFLTKTEERQSKSLK